MAVTATLVTVAVIVFLFATVQPGDTGLRLEIRDMLFWWAKANYIFVLPIWLLLRVLDWAMGGPSRRRRKSQP